MPGSSLRWMGEQERLRVRAPGGRLGGSVRQHHSQSVYSLASCPSTPLFVVNSPGEAFVITHSPLALEWRSLIWSTQVLKKATHNHKKKKFTQYTSHSYTICPLSEVVCVYFHKQLTCVSQLAGTLVSIDLVNALAIVTWVALAVIQIDLTVNTCEPNSSQTLKQKLFQETQSAVIGFIQCSKLSKNVFTFAWIYIKFSI